MERRTKREILTAWPLCVWFEGKAIWRAADAVSLASALALAAYVLKKRRRA